MFIFQVGLFVQDLLPLLLSLLFFIQNLFNAFIVYLFGNQLVPHRVGVADSLRVLLMDV
jgi:hypothetical protein